MFAKKNRATVSSRTFQRQLTSLYARRSAINSLIESLEDYQRFRVKRRKSCKPAAD